MRDIGYSRVESALPEKFSTWNFSLIPNGRSGWLCVGGGGVLLETAIKGFGNGSSYGSPVEVVSKTVCSTLCKLTFKSCVTIIALPTDSVNSRLLC